MLWQHGRKAKERGPIDEKRKFHRIKIIIGLLCRRSQGNNINVFTDDVSVGGIRFFSHQSLAKKEEVSLEIPVGYGETIRIEGQVAWIKEKGPNSYEGGIEFTRMSDENLKAWKKFIKRNSEQGEDIEI